MNKIGEGQESEVYAIKDHKVIKLYKNLDETIVNYEMKILRLIDSIGIRVPKVYEYIYMQGKHGFSMEHIRGNSILSLIENNPFLTFKMAKIFGITHSQIHKTYAPDVIPKQKEQLRNCIKQVNYLSDEIIEYTIKLLEELPDVNCICHGDYNPSNIIITKDNPVFIDWTGVSRGDPTGDVAHTLLILKNGQFPPNTSIVLQFLFRIGRNIFAIKYLSSYQKNCRLEVSSLSKWEMIMAVARLTYGGMEEKKALLKYINRYYMNRYKNKNILF